MYEFLRNLPILATKLVQYSYELSVDSSVEYKPFLAIFNIQYILRELSLKRAFYQTHFNEFKNMVNSMKYARHKVM